MTEVENSWFSKKYLVDTSNLNLNKSIISQTFGDLRFNFTSTFDNQFNNASMSGV